MNYKLKQFSKRIQNQLRRLPNRVQNEIIEIILELASDPYPLISEPLRDQYDDLRKIKVDGYRIIYKVNEADRTVTVSAVKRRDRDTYTNIYSLLF